MGALTMQRGLLTKSGQRLTYATGFVLLSMAFLCANLRVEGTWEFKNSEDVDGMAHHVHTRGTPPAQTSRVNKN